MFKQIKHRFVTKFWNHSFEGPKVYIFVTLMCAACIALWVTALTSHKMPWQ